MMTSAILIIMISLSTGEHVHHVKHIDEGYLSYNSCMWQRDALLKIWRKRSDVDHLDIRCPEWWSET